MKGHEWELLAYRYGNEWAILCWFVLTLREPTKDERQGKRRCGVLRWQDTTPAYISQFAMYTVCDHGFKLLPRPQYCMGQVPSDYFIFSKLKKEFSGQRYINDNELTLAVEEFFRECGSVFYRLGRNAQPRWYQVHRVSKRLHWKIYHSHLWGCCFLYQC